MRVRTADAQPLGGEVLRNITTAILLVGLVGCQTMNAPRDHRSGSMTASMIAGPEEIIVEVRAQGAPVALASVQVCLQGGVPILALTGSDGIARFAAGEGTWTVEVFKEYMANESGKIQVEAGHSTLVSVTLHPSREDETITIGEPPDFWTEHAPGKYTLYNHGGPWPVPWW